ncbi:MAG: hypothetical protein JW388_1307 [Nitrospira sp.]|nr:hypothetical protein [Nitrospira sp.]
MVGLKVVAVICGVGLPTNFVSSASRLSPANRSIGDNERFKTINPSLAAMTFCSAANFHQAQASGKLPPTNEDRPS